MSNDTPRSNAVPPTIFPLEALKKARQEQNSQALANRIQVEVACREPIGRVIHDLFTAQFESLGCRVQGEDKPDWILSVIAFSAGNTVELSIVLRRLFRSTLPGTERESVDADGATRLRAGGWVYESLRFHGLFGVPTGELEPFVARMVRDFPVHRKDTHDHRQSKGNMQ
jgi:hypothetical protein